MTSSSRSMSCLFFSHGIDSTNYCGPCKNSLAYTIVEEIPLSFINISNWLQIVHCAPKFVITYSGSSKRRAWDQTFLLIITGVCYITKLICVLKSQVFAKFVRPSKMFFAPKSFSFCTCKSCVHILIKIDPMG